jgi:uncharacterized protein YcbX
VVQHRVGDAAELQSEVPTLALCPDDQPIGGWAEPHAEDRAHRITIGDTELGYAKLATRCSVTMIDQSSGTKAGPEPLRALAGYRRAAQGGVAFGAKFAVLRPGKVSVGDEVVVGRWGESELHEERTVGRPALE